MLKFPEIDFKNPKNFPRNFCKKKPRKILNGFQNSHDWQLWQLPTLENSCQNPPQKNGVVPKIAKAMAQMITELVTQGQKIKNHPSLQV